MRVMYLTKIAKLNFTSTIFRRSCIGSPVLHEFYRNNFRPIFLVGVHKVSQIKLYDLIFWEWIDILGRKRNLNLAQLKIRRIYYTGCLENGGLTLRYALNKQLVSLGKIVKKILLTFWMSYNDFKIASFATFNN